MWNQFSSQQYVLYGLNAGSFCTASHLASCALCRLPVDEPREEHHGAHDAGGVPGEEHGDHHAVVVRLGVPLPPAGRRVQDEAHRVEPGALQPHREAAEQVHADVVPHEDLQSHGQGAQRDRVHQERVYLRSR